MTDIYWKHPPQARMTTGARAQMLVEARAWTHRHAEVGARMITEVHCINVCTDVTCKEYHVSLFTDVSTDCTSMHGSTYPYISTKFTDVHGVTSTEKFRVNMVVHGRRNAYDKYRRS